GHLQLPLGDSGLGQPATSDGPPVGAPDPRGRIGISEPAHDLYGAARWQPAAAGVGSGRRAGAEVDPARAPWRVSRSLHRCAQSDEQRLNRERPEPARRSARYVRRAVEVRVPATAAIGRTDQILRISFRLVRGGHVGPPLPVYFGQSITGGTESRIQFESLPKVRRRF